MEIDRRAFIASLGGAAVVGAMDHETRADALEDHAVEELNAAVGQAQATDERFPTVAELDALNQTRTTRRGAGNLFVAHGDVVSRLKPMPAKPTLKDFFELRFAPANHVLQSATRALKTGMSEEIVLACLLHDTVQSIMKTDHGWWGAQLYEPYVPEKTTFAVRYHQALRFYPDPQAGYEYPDLYRRVFGVDYQPPPHIEATYKMVRNHKWYDLPRMVTVNDLYAFEPGVVVEFEQFTDLLGRHFRQPKEGLGFDNTPVAHIWRSIAMPDHPL